MTFRTVNFVWWRQVLKLGCSVNSKLFIRLVVCGLVCSEIWTGRIVPYSIWIRSVNYIREDVTFQGWSAVKNRPRWQFDRFRTVDHQSTAPILFITWNCDDRLLVEVSHVTNDPTSIDNYDLPPGHNRRIIIIFHRLLEALVQSWNFYVRPGTSPFRGGRFT